VSHSAAAANGFIAAITHPKDAVIFIKGIGRITLWDSGGVQTSRAAWAGVSDGRIRIEVLGLPGHPVAKFIYDGENYVFVSPADQKSYRKSVADADLEILTGVSVPSTDIVQLLSGMIPVKKFDEAWFQDGASDCQNILVLKRKWQGVVQKLFLNDTHDRVVKIEIYRWGRLVYSAEIGNMKSIEGRDVPFHLVFLNANQKGFSIDVEKCWPDTDLSPEVFSIEIQQ
jgi:hypothetical protein